MTELPSSDSINHIDDYQSRNRITFLLVGSLLAVVFAVVAVTTNWREVFSERRQLLVSATNELPMEIRQIFDAADDLEVIRLPLSGNESISPVRFENYSANQRIKVGDPDIRNRLRAAIYSGIANDDPGVIPCFDPAYGVRAVAGDKSAGLIICFHCDAILYYLNDQYVGGVGTASDAQPIIEELLR